MGNYLPALKKCPLFSGIHETDLVSLLRCLSAIKREYEKNEFIFLAREKPASVGIVLSGGVHIVQEDFWGNRAILTRHGEGDSFGEAFSCGNVERLPVGAVAAERSVILLLNTRKIVTTCSSSCIFHSQLINNLLKLLADNNILLMQKIEHYTKRTTREKLLSYLSAQAAAASSDHFKIPFNRQELADYLSVDRSAMSRELCRMRDEGILAFDGRAFELKRAASSFAAN